MGKGARSNEQQRLNAALACMCDLADLFGHCLSIYFPGSEEAQEKLGTLRLMIAGLIKERAGFPVAEDIAPVTTDGGTPQ